MSQTPERPEDPRPRLTPIGFGALAVCGVLGLVVGWSSRHLLESWRGFSPVITWPQPAALALIALILGATAAYTRRELKGVAKLAFLLEPHRAVNRLVMGRAGALAGALVAGGYAGYAISWLGVRAELANSRLMMSGLAALAAVLVMVAGVLLERACRVPEGPSGP